MHDKYFNLKYLFEYDRDTFIVLKFNLIKTDKKELVMGKFIINSTYYYQYPSTALQC